MPALMAAKASSDSVNADRTLVLAGTAGAVLTEFAFAEAVSVCSGESLKEPD